MNRYWLGIILNSAILLFIVLVMLGVISYTLGLWVTIALVLTLVLMGGD